MHVGRRVTEVAVNRDMQGWYLRSDKSQQNLAVSSSERFRAWAWVYREEQALC